MINPHGMDPKTVLRFVKSVGGWPGKVVIVACEPASVETMGMELSAEVGGRGRARGRRGARAGRRAAVQRRLRGLSGARALALERDLGDRPASCRGPPREVRADADRRACARSSPSRSSSTSRSSPAAPLCEGAALEADDCRRALRCEGCATEWEPRAAAFFRCPSCAGGDGRGSWAAPSSRSSRSRLEEEEAACIAPR